jgi:DNA polymerase III alpha subunit
MNIGSNAEPVSVGKPYEDIADMATRANAPESVLKTLVEAGACNEMIDTRRGTDEGVRALKSVFVQMRESERAAQARLRKTQTTPDTGGLFDFEPTSGIGIRRALQKMDDDLAESRSAKGKSKGGKTGDKSAPKSKLEW